MALIPKPSGGRRPIGIEPTLTRWWEKLRKPYVAAWRLQVQRPFDCLTAGIPCEQAVFEQTVYDEALEGRNQHSASALVDITKAFETIILEYAYAAARELKFPPALLRLTLEICSFLRFLRYENAVSDPVHSLSAVVAGSCFATDLMFVMLVMPIEMMIARFSVRVFTVVDDVTIRAEGAPGAVSTQLSGAVRFFVGKLENDLKMTISRGRPWAPTRDTKSVAVAGTPELRRRIMTGMRALGFHVRSKVKNLGIDYAPRTKVGKREVLMQRQVQTATRGGRAKRLPKAAAVRISNTGIRPAREYGAVVTGLPTSLMNRFRTDAAGVRGPIGGRSVAMRLAIHDEDPLWRHRRKVVCMWSWSKRVADDYLADAWRHAITTVGLSDRPNVESTGGTGVVVAVLRELGWSFPSSHVLMTVDGTLLDLREVCTATVVEYLRDDHDANVAADSLVAQRMRDFDGSLGFPRTVAQRPQQQRQQHSQGQEHLGDAAPHPHSYFIHGVNAANRDFVVRAWRDRKYATRETQPVPWVEPLRRFAALKSSARSAAAASVLALAESGWWSPWRMFVDRMADSPRCACGKPVACVWHMLGECPLGRRLRDEYGNDDMFVQAAEQVWNPLFHCGFPMRPKMPPDPIDPRELYGELRAPLSVSGDVFTDGALRGRCRRVLR